MTDGSNELGTNFFEDPHALPVVKFFHTAKADFSPFNSLSSALALHKLRRQVLKIGATAGIEPMTPEINRQQF